MSPAPDSPASLLAALRAGTRALHDRAESAFVLADAGRATRAVYAAVLARLAGYHAAAEAALAPWGPALAGYGVDLAARAKTPLLRRDLAALGGAETATAPWDTPFDVPTAAHAFGLAYVLEGATLGGQLLRRQLGPALGLTPEHGLAFFTAYGAEVGPMWRAFTAALERFDADTPPAARPAARAAAVAAAQAAFVAFERAVAVPVGPPIAAPAAPPRPPAAVAAA